MSLVVKEQLELDPLFRSGDHIRRNCGAFDHHAIFVKWIDFASQLAMLIHRNGKNKASKIELEEANVAHHHLVSRSTKPALVVQRALSRVGEAGYHLIMKNCEHFCTWCITGDATSTQIGRGILVSASELHHQVTGRRGFGVSLAVTALSFEACKQVRAYMDGYITRADLIRSMTIATVSIGSGLVGAAAGANLGSRAMRGLGPGGMLLGAVVGGISGGFLGRHVGSSVSELVMNHFEIGLSRAETLLNAYNTLGLDPNATNQEINAAYRRQAREHHPDRGGSTEAFQQINTAMEVIRVARSDENEPLPCGTRVKAQWKGRWEYYTGYIEVAHGNQTYDVALDNGVLEKSVDIRYIRPM